MKDQMDYDNVALARSLFDAFAAGALSLWKAQLSSDFTFAYPGLPDGKGADAAFAYNMPFLAAFSDWVTETHAAAVDGEHVFLSITVHATHSGALVTPQGTLPASQRRGMIKAVIYARVRGGKIVHESTYWNVNDLMAQLIS